MAAVGDRPEAQIARELGIRLNQLRSWRLEFEAQVRLAVPRHQWPFRSLQRVANAALAPQCEAANRRPLFVLLPNCSD